MIVVRKRINIGYEVDNFQFGMINLLALLIGTIWLSGKPCESQFSPIWQASPYIQSRSLVVVSNGQKTTGTYTLTVTFSYAFSSRQLVLAIPQLRMIAGYSLGFRQFDSGLSASGFTHNLLINDVNTTIYYMVSRYTVFNTAVLTKEFQTYTLADQAGASISAGPSASSRSDTFSITLSPTPTLANNPICLPFLSGVTASSSSDYQLNLTCSISSTSAVVTAVVYPSTSVSLVSFYIVVWDPVVLAAQSYLFVDYAVTTTYYNTQSTPLTLKYGYLDGGYCGGMGSFSTTAQQELNFTLSNLTLSTTQSSLFNSAPQFQIRVRNCSSSSSPLFNSADQLCYPLCPSSTYSVAGAFLCSACPSNCLTCLNASICTNCSSGMTVVNSTCVCNSGTYLSGSTCIGCHYSCLTCAPTGQYFHCLTCNGSHYRTASAVVGFNYQCACNTGYYDGGGAICVEVCGDGVARTDACDDGNTISGDGCSSRCIIQANFTCTKNGAGLSSCYYTGQVSIQEVKIFKEEYEDVFKVYLRITPWIDSMSQLANSVSLTSNFTDGVAIGYSVRQGLLEYSFYYDKEVQNDYLTVFLKPFSPGIFSQLPAANCTFQLNSDNGFELKPYTATQYQIAQSFHYMGMIFGYLMAVSGFLFIFGRLKWMGNLLFFSLQFQYLSMVIIPRFNPMLSGLSQIKIVMGYNEIFGKQDFDIPKYPALYVLNYNKQYDYNVNVMVAVQGLALVMYCFYKVTYNRNQLLCKKYGGDPEKSYKALKWGKVLQFFDWEFFMFWTFFNMINQLTAVLLYTELPQPEFLPLIVFNVLCIILAIAPLLVRRKQIKSYTELLYRADRGHEESLVSLVAYIIMFSLVGLALTVSRVLYYAVGVVPVAMMAYICCRRPFASKWMRAAYFVNCFCMLTSLVYNLLTIAFQDEVYYLPFGSLITFLIDWVFNLVVWGREAYVICKYGGERDLNQLLASNTKTSSNDDTGDNFFRDIAPKPNQNNSSVLSPILKQHAKTKRPSRRDKLDEDTPIGIREEQQAQLKEEQQQERKELQLRREKWMQEMKDMKQSRNMRERTRHEIEARTLAKSPVKSKIRTTAQKGIEQEQLQATL